MTVVAKTSAYPKSVQSGLPRLGACPPGWTRGPLSAHLIEELRPLNMSDDEVYDLVTVKRSRGGVVLRERLKGSQIAVKSQFRLKAGDFLISKRQIVHGACGIVPPELDGAIVSNEYSVLRARPSLDLNFLNCLAHSIYFQQTCFHSSIGVHVEKMIFKLDQWMKWDFDLPPHLEQRRIVEILGTWDLAVEKVERLVANARSQKAALMQDLLLGKRRLPGFVGNWSGRTISDAAELDRESLGVATPSDFSFRYISLSNVQPGSISGDLETMTFSSAPSRARRKINTGDILMATVRPNLQAFAKVLPEHQDCVASTGFCVLSARPGQDPSFLFHQLFGDRITSQIDALVVGSNYPAINSSDVANLRFDCPDIEEQVALSTVLDCADFSVQGREAQLAALQQERAALRQQLLTGRRTVTVQAEAA
jgi:type I restriction enzyme S subunit